jgi:hypothetical protein
LLPLLLLRLLHLRLLLLPDFGERCLSGQPCSSPFDSGGMLLGWSDGSGKLILCSLPDLTQRPFEVRQAGRISMVGLRQDGFGSPRGVLCQKWVG